MKWTLPSVYSLNQTPAPEKAQTLELRYGLRALGLKVLAVVGLAAANAAQRLFPSQYWALHETRLKRVVWETRRVCGRWLEGRRACEMPAQVAAVHPMQAQSTTPDAPRRIAVIAVLLFLTLVNWSGRRKLPAPPGVDKRRTFHPRRKRPSVLLEALLVNC
jgi:hypothetical protein